MIKSPYSNLNRATMIRDTLSMVGNPTKSAHIISKFSHSPPLSSRALFYVHDAKQVFFEWFVDSDIISTSSA
jgi:hypothetical protein